MALTHRNKCHVWLPSPPSSSPLPRSLFLTSLLPSVFNPAQFARLDETILVISACNGTLLTPITTIKTLLPLGPFQVLINQMAAKRLFGAHQPLLNTQDTHTHPHTGTHAHLLTSLDRPCGLAKKHIWRNKTSPCWQTNALTLQMKGKPLSFTLPLCLFLSLFPSLWCGYNEHYKPPWHSALLRGFGKLPSLFLTNCLIDALFLLMIRICPLPPFLLSLPTAAHGYRYKRNYTLLASHGPFQQTVLET